MKSFKAYLVLWFTQLFSGFGSKMTVAALSIWTYNLTGSALASSMLLVCSYAPYVILSIFAGALSDRWNKKATMLISDSVAALCTIIVLILLRTGHLQLWHLYVTNIINGCMNTVQQPASEVATTRLLPEKYYQKVGALGYFSMAINQIFPQIIAIGIMGLWGIHYVIAIDLFTFIAAFFVLLFFIHIPEDNTSTVAEKEPVLQAAKKGLIYLQENRGIFVLILFLAAINLTSSMYGAAMGPMILSRNGGSAKTLGLIEMTNGIAMLIGSIFATLMKQPKSRVRVICNTLLFSMSFNNFILAFGQSRLVWCGGALLGWLFIPMMSTNLDAIMRTKVPEEIQGRVYATRNSLQFFTIPIGNFMGGFLVDQVFEPFMKGQSSESLLVHLFGSGKGSGAALFFFFIAFIGIFTCLYFRRDPNLWALEMENSIS